jgi:hypothetical protein
VQLARTLVRTGRVAGLRGPGRIQRDDAAKERLRAEQLKATVARRAAAAQLAGDGVYERVLDEPETEALLSLLGIALVARVPVSRSVSAAGGPGPAATGSSDGVRLTLRPAPGVTTVRTVRGRLHLDGLAIEVTSAAAAPAAPVPAARAGTAGRPA